MKKQFFLTMVICTSLLFGSCGRNNTVSLITSEKYTNAQNYLVGDFSYAAESINSVAVNWYCGRVEFVESDCDILKVFESGTFSDDTSAMHYMLQDGVLNIQFCESGASVSVLSKDKQLTVEVPKGVKITVDTSSGTIVANTLEAASIYAVSLSGDMSFGNLQASEISITSSSGGILANQILSDTISCKTSSGVITLGSLEANDVMLKSSSGKISCESITANTLEAETSSGVVALCDLAVNINIVTSSGAIELEISEKTALSVKTDAGQVTLTLPRNGVEVQYSTTSGKLRTNATYENSGKIYVFSNGESTVNVKTSSGSLQVNIP